MQAPSAAPPTGSRSSPQAYPLWIPPGVTFEDLCPALQAALVDIIGPAYAQLVQAAPNGFESVVGMSYIRLAWLELVQQVTLGRDLGVFSKAGPSEDSEKRLGQLLRVVRAKSRTGKFLLGLQKTFEKLGDTDPLRRVPR